MLSNKDGWTDYIAGFIDCLSDVFSSNIESFKRSGKPTQPKYES